MKIRTGFVSNSSSSSFVVAKKFLTDDQIKAIRRHGQYAKKHFPEMDWPDDTWSIHESDYTICGHTIMDNFSMAEFLEKIGVDMDVVKIESD